MIKSSNIAQCVITLDRHKLLFFSGTHLQSRASSIQTGKLPSQREESAPCSNCIITMMNIDDA